MDRINQLTMGGWGAVGGPLARILDQLQELAPPTSKKEQVKTRIIES